MKVMREQNREVSCIKREQQVVRTALDLQALSDSISRVIQGYPGLDESQQRQLTNELLNCFTGLWSPPQPGSLQQEMVHVLCHDDHMLRNQHLAQYSHKLTFKHACTAMSCSDEDCNLCKNSITRQCPESDFFEDKYVRGRDPVAAKCGGSIQVWLEDRSTGQICNRDVDLRVLVVNGHLFDREFGALEDQICVDHVYEKLQIFANQDYPCLFTCSDKNIIMSREGLLMQMEGGVAVLPSGMLLTCSSKTNEDKNRYFRLVVLTISSIGGSVLAAVSPKLHCISPRFGRDPTRSKNRPHVKDSITVLDDIGPKRRTVLNGFNIYSVGDLKSALEKDPENRGEVTKFGRAVVGNLAGAWDKICESALLAAEEDDRRRVWTHEHFKAIFDCKQAMIDMSGPVEVVQHDGDKIAPDQISVRAINEIRNMALEDWERPHHPNWSILGEANIETPNTNETPQYTLCVPRQSMVLVVPNSYQDPMHCDE